MILEELEELSTFIKKESGVPNVWIVIPGEQTGLYILIDHGTESYEKDSNILMAILPVTLTISSDKKDWKRVLKITETLQREMRIQKKHKYNVQEFDRVESETDYTLKLNLSLPLPIV